METRNVYFLQKTNNIDEEERLKKLIAKFIYKADNLFIIYDIDIQSFDNVYHLSFVYLIYIWYGVNILLPHLIILTVYNRK